MVVARSNCSRTAVESKQIVVVTSLTENIGDIAPKILLSSTKFSYGLVFWQQNHIFRTMKLLSTKIFIVGGMWTGCCNGRAIRNRRSRRPVPLTTGWSWRADHVKWCGPSHCRPSWHRHRHQDSQPVAVSVNARRAITNLTDSHILLRRRWLANDMLYVVRPSFLPRDAMRKRGLCCGPVSVCPSITLWILPTGWKYRQTSFSAR